MFNSRLPSVLYLHPLVRLLFYCILLLLTACLPSAPCYAQRDTSRLSLLFLGDIMQHDSQIKAAYDPSRGVHDYTHCFEFISPLFESVDLAIGNLELTLGGPPFKGYPQFSAPDELAQALKASGVDVLVTANNHCVDRGRSGLERTIAVLDSLQIPHTGTFIDSAARAQTYPMIIEKSGFRLSLLNYTYGTNGIAVPRPTVVNLIDTVQIGSDLDCARARNTDAVIVFFHWGAEYQSLPDNSQKRVAEFCLRNGAKLVIGAHPHVIQPMEWRKEQDQLVVYSLGNFVSGQRTRYRDGGAMVFVDLEKTITQSDTATRIQSVSYELQYVYQDAGRRFVVLPVKDFEHDTTVVREDKARLLLEQFAADSRALLRRHNINVDERPTLRDSMFFVAIPLDSLQETEADSLSVNDPLLKFYNVRYDSAGNGTLWLGGFDDGDVAATVQHEVMTTRGYRYVVIVKRPLRRHERVLMKN
jgi:poly-gamma-glutamate capsule biosynthesis protein CapA/YwtB (metallophosphatase superfamily)